MVAWLNLGPQHPTTIQAPDPNHGAHGEVHLGTPEVEGYGTKVPKDGEGTWGHEAKLRATNLWKSCCWVADDDDEEEEDAGDDDDG